MATVETKVGLQDGYEKPFETMTRLPFPGTGSTEPFVVKVTGGTYHNP